MKSRFVLAASCLSLLATGSCTSSNPDQVTTDMAMMSVDLSVGGDVADMSMLPDYATTPPDMASSCGFGQVRDTGSGACTCDPGHASMCTGNTYCCGSTQICLTNPGPRGETLCSGPSVREAAAIGFDPIRYNLVLRTGGCQDLVPNPVLCADQWALGQTTWDVQTSATTVTPRYGSSMAWLPTNQMLLLFGGQTTKDSTTTAVSDLYGWNGVDWTKLAAGPPARAFTAMAYDAGRDRLVLFGGNDKGDNELQDTWEYNGKTNAWVQRVFTAGTDPQVREGHGMVYDTNINKIVLHGGLVGGANGRDTWTFDGADWVKLADSTITVHSYFAMAFDPVRKVTVLYGGETTAGAQLAETWEFNGATWTNRAPVTNPGKRTKPAMAYDAGRKQMVLFGGNNGSLLKDAWAWDGTAWTKLY